jgi:glycine oxidase
LFPPLVNATPVKRWIGFRPRPVEGDGPHIGRVAGTNVWLAYGHYRNGILLTPVTAQRVAGEISVLPGA